MNKNDCVNKIIAGYASRLNAKKAAVAAAVQKLRDGDEAFAALERELCGLRVDCARNSAEGRTDKALSERLEKDERAYEQYLKNYTLKYDCDKCKDTGWAGGKLCACVRQKLHEETVKASGLSTVLHTYGEWDFNVFPENIREERKKIYDLSVEYCKKFPNPRYKNMFITGNIGSGKTFLVSCIAGEFLKTGYTVQFLTSYKFGKLMLEAHLAPVEDRDGIIEPVLETDLLILDDLGAEPIWNNVTVEYLYLVLNERLNAGAATILTTNLNPSEFLKHYGGRVFSRAANKETTYLIRMDGPDLRIRG